jgi:single-stranded-DNA-specific exonuclease
MERKRQILKPDPDKVEGIRRVLKCSPITARVLANRNIFCESELVDFFAPSLNRMRPPFAIKDTDVAVRRIYQAIMGNENILVFGDYDVDGVTATTIMVEFLRYAGAGVSYYIPHRTKEGYGLHVDHIQNGMLMEGINLIITVDCGSGSHDAVEAAQRAGIDVIITDHHKISENPPRAVAVVNPNRRDCRSKFGHLAGVGVAFCLLICLRAYLREMNFWVDKPEPNLKQMCDLVALGTIADMVPLLSENRIFSKAGLEMINTGSRPGIKALMESCRTGDRQAADQRIGADDLAFRLAPRINAPGRIDHAGRAVDLLTTSNVDEARRIARDLGIMNSKRQNIEKRILDEIHDHLAKNPLLLQNRVLVLVFHGWHEGVLGIVASRIVERYYRPAVLLSIKGDMGKGSARSIPGFDLYEGLCACASNLEQFGGHSMAAGVKVRVENIPRFKSDLEKAVREGTRPEDFVPTTVIDMELSFDDISDRLLDELESLQPFGNGNAEPLFMARDIDVLSTDIVGGHHRRMSLGQNSGSTFRTLNAIQFNIDPDAEMNPRLERMTFRLRWNRWNGRRHPQIVVEEL